MRAVIIGGGAAGLMCASLLSAKGAEVILLEKNEKLGKKLFLTGKGRCNITNDCDVETFISNVVTNPRFVFSAINGFTPQDSVKFFEDNGLRVKVERGNRVFPQSDKSSDVIKCFEKILQSNGVDVRLNCEVKDLTVCDGEVKGAITDRGFVSGDCVIVATGGVSYQATGSTGDGYRWAKKFGHKVISPRPALVPMLLKDAGGLQGLSLKNVTASIARDGKILRSQFGEMLFTHSGASGPIILSLSSLINKYYGNGKFDGKYILQIDLKPALDEDTLQRRLIREFEQNINCEIKNILPSLMPRALVFPVLKQSGIKEKQVANAVTKQQREQLVKAIKRLSFEISGLESINAGIVTSGGIDCKQIDPKTMMSKIVKGLYFIGEVLDIDALTGGFNLQLAFATANQVCRCIDIN